MTDKQLSNHIKAILSDFKDYKTCKEIDVDCYQCKIMIMLGYLTWFEDLLDYPQESKKTSQKKKKKV